MERTIDSYSGSATFDMAEGTFTAECEYAVQQTMVLAGSEWLPGLIGWRGSFATSATLAWTGEATIRLEDGRTGSVVVTYLTQPGGYGTFTGNGETPS